VKTVPLCAALIRRKSYWKLQKSADGTRDASYGVSIISYVFATCTTIINDELKPYQGNGVPYHLMPISWLSGRWWCWEDLMKDCWVLCFQHRLMGVGLPGRVEASWQSSPEIPFAISGQWATIHSLCFSWKSWQVHGIFSRLLGRWEDHSGCLRCWWNGHGSAVPLSAWLGRLPWLTFFFIPPY